MCAAFGAGAADTLEGALVQAYQNNPSLNSQRASVRATDEGVPQALAGYRPRVTANGSVGTNIGTRRHAQRRDRSGAPSATVAL